MTEKEIQESEAICRAASDGPWLDITTLWNETLQAFRKRTKRAWHGFLQGSRKTTDSCQCDYLIVQDAGPYVGRIETMLTECRDQGRRVEPDYYDLREVIALPMYSVKWDRGMRYVGGKISLDTKEAERNRRFIASARTGWPAALAEVRRLREMVKELGGTPDTSPEEPNP